MFKKLRNVQDTVKSRKQNLYKKNLRVMFTAESDSVVCGV